jgi:hypothetical protein
MERTKEDTLLYVYNVIYSDFTRFKRKRKKTTAEIKLGNDIYKTHLTNLQKIIKDDFGIDAKFKEME